MELGELRPQDITCELDDGAQARTTVLREGERCNGCTDWRVQSDVRDILRTAGDLAAAVRDGDHFATVMATRELTNRATANAQRQTRTTGRLHDVIRKVALPTAAFCLISAMLYLGMAWSAADSVAAGISEMLPSVTLDGLAALTGLMLGFYFLAWASSKRALPRRREGNRR